EGVGGGDVGVEEVLPGGRAVLLVERVGAGELRPGAGDGLIRAPEGEEAVEAGGGGGIGVGGAGGEGGRGGGVGARAELGGGVLGAGDGRLREAVGEIAAIKEREVVEVAGEEAAGDDGLERRALVAADDVYGLVGVSVEGGVVVVEVGVLAIRVVGLPGE